MTPDEETLRDIGAELAKARLKHRGINSLHEGVAVIREEYLEAEREVFTQHFDRGAIYKELTHLAAMCVRMIVDLDLRP